MYYPQIVVHTCKVNKFISFFGKYTWKTLKYRLNNSAIYPHSTYSGCRPVDNSMFIHNFIHTLSTGFMGLSTGTGLSCVYNWFQMWLCCFGCWLLWITEGKWFVLVNNTGLLYWADVQVMARRHNLPCSC